MVEKLNQNLPEIDVVKEETQTELIYLKEKVSSSKEKDNSKESKELKKLKKNTAKLAPDISKSLQIGILEDIDKLKISLREWKWAESLLDNLGKDLVDLIDEKTVGLFINLILNDDSKITYELLNEKETKEEVINFIENFCKIIAKYLERISEMFSKGLKDNFKDVPEPIKSHFIKNKDKIGELEKNLLLYAGLTDKFGQSFIDLFKEKEFNYKKLNEQTKTLSYYMDSMFASFSDLEDVFNVEPVIEGIMRINLKKLERNIRGTKMSLNWGGERGEVWYDYLHKKIISWGNEVEIDKINLNSIKLKGLDVELYLEAGIWLANFKNWKNKKYGNKKVEFKNDFFNKNFKFKKTFVVDGKMLITREELENNIRQCGSDDVMEKIAAWLNK